MPAAILPFGFIVEAVVVVDAEVKVVMLTQADIARTVHRNTHLHWRFIMSL